MVHDIKGGEKSYLFTFKAFKIYKRIFSALILPIDTGYLILHFPYKILNKGPGAIQNFKEVQVN